MQKPTETKVTTGTREGLAIIPGSLPLRCNTVVADVLQKLLNRQHITSLDAVFSASTTRLGAAIFYLQKQYGWVISRTDKVVGCVDGRVAMVSEYWLDADVVAAAMAGGAAHWCAKVRAARKARRADAAQARRIADRANAAAAATRRRRVSLGLAQFDLFGSVEVEVEVSVCP